MSKRKPLSQEERRAKGQFKVLFELNKKNWEARTGERLTQQRLAEIAGLALNGEPYTQGMVWQYLSPNTDVRVPVKFAQFVASMLEFDPAEIGPAFAIPSYLKDASSAGAEKTISVGWRSEGQPFTEKELRKLGYGLPAEIILEVLSKNVHKMTADERLRLARIALAEPFPKTR